MHQPARPARILASHHIGIRVSARPRAMAFYQALGFVESASFPLFEANEMLSPDGVRINLIFNGARAADAHNVLLDAPVKRPGMTHPAFIVDDLAALQQWLEAPGIVITAGPHPIGPPRIALFTPHPAAHVLPFNHLTSGGSQ